MNVTRIVSIVVAFLLAACAQQPGPFGSATDKAIVETPSHAETRIRFLPQQAALGANATVPLEDPWNPGAAASYFQRRDPISIIVNDVRLPDDMDSGGQDIAIIVYPTTNAGSEGDPVMVWFQRGVRPGQLLHFGSLTIFSDSRRDPDLAPRIRLRVVQVGAIRAREVDQAIQRASGFAPILSLALPNPALTPAVGAAAEAARLINAELGGRNKNLLEFTGQFYTQQQSAMFPGANPLSLRAGSFVMFAAKSGTTAKLDDNLGYNFRSTRVETNPGGGAAGSAIPGLGHIRVSLARYALLVPRTVAANSATIIELIQQNATANSAAIAEAAERLQRSAEVWNDLQVFRAAPSPTTFSTMSSKISQTAAWSALSSADRDLITTMIWRATNCLVTSPTEFSNTFTGTRAIAALRFKQDALEVADNLKCAP